MGHESTHSGDGHKPWDHFFRYSTSKTVSPGPLTVSHLNLQCDVYEAAIEVGIQL
jgi:hypothetical protein